MKYLIPFVLALALIGCGDSNPLIGKWKLQTEGLRPEEKLTAGLIDGGSEFTVEFTKNSITQTSGWGTQMADVEYRVEGNTVFINKKGENQWKPVSVEGKNTLTGYIGLKLVRVR